MSRPLRIAMTADPEIPVPPKHYGGIERLIDMLIRGLAKRGHEVTLFADRASTVPCNLVPYPVNRSRGWRNSLKNMKIVTSHVVKSKYDIVHSFGRLFYLLCLLPRAIPKIMTYQRAVSPRSVILGNLISAGSLYFTGASRQQIRQVEKYGQWEVIYNGVPLAAYHFAPKVSFDAPLVFLGRVERIKGTHLAVEVAKRSKRRLLIAGNVEAEHKSYFRNEISPHIDGDRIIHVGAVDDAQKDELLGRAAALLMPVLFDEPFGLVMAEALACGTPVIGLKRGSIPEVIEDGVTGFVCDSVSEMVEVVPKIDSIDRANCRKSVEERFNDQTFVSAYVRLYEEITAPHVLLING